MNSVFSVDDLTDSFWQPPAAPGNGITRSQSEWAFQRLLEEMSASSGSPISSSSATDNAIGRSTSQPQSEPSVSKQGEAKPQNRAPSSDSTVEIDPNHYQAILKSKLELACAAAVALRVGTVNPEDSSASSGNQKQPAPIGSQTQGPAVTEMSPCVSSVSAATSLSAQNKPDSQARQATSGLSRDDSDDEDLDGETENADPADVKRARRKISNRESARRSRRRKQEQMNELDTQAGQLRTEHSALLKRLGDMNQKYDTAVVDNRVLKADIETLRTKVKMAEETVKRVTGMNPLLVARPNSIPFNSALTESSLPNSNLTLKPANLNSDTIPNQMLENNFANDTVVPVNMSQERSNIGLKNSLKVPLPQSVPFPSHLPAQVNQIVPASCNAYETLPHWSHTTGKNKPQE